MVPIRAAGLIALAGMTAACVLPARANPVSPAEMAKHEKGFGALQQGSRTFSAQIRQTLSLEGLSKPLLSQGTLYYAAPDRLLVRFSQPAGEWMLVNGTRAAVKKQGKPVDLKDLSSQGKKSSQAASLLDFFRNGPDRWHHDFDVTMTREGDHLVVHLKPWMTPTATFQGVEGIVTTLQLPGYEIVSMEITLSGPNRVRYDFSGVQRNIPLASSLFAMPRDSAP